MKSRFCVICYSVYIISKSSIRRIVIVNIVLFKFKKIFRFAIFKRLKYKNIFVLIPSVLKMLIVMSISTKRTLMLLKPFLYIYRTSYITFLIIWIIYLINTRIHHTPALVLFLRAVRAFIFSL